MVPHFFVKKHLANRHSIDSLYKEIFNQMMSEQCWPNAVQTKCFWQKMWSSGACSI